MLIIQKLEKKRIEDYNKKKQKKNYIKYPNIVGGEYVVMWYMSREKEKGLLRFQFNKGICMSTNLKWYNSKFKIRSVLSGIAIEQQFFNYSRFNMLMILKKNPLKNYKRNSLKFLRKKKNKKSKFKVQ